MVVTQHYTTRKKGDLSNVEETNNVLWYDIDASLPTTPPRRNSAFTSKSTAEDETFVGDFLPVSPASSSFVCACMYVHSKIINLHVVYIIIYVWLSFIYFNIFVAVEQLIPPIVRIAMMNSASWHSMDRPIYKAFPNYDYTVL
jgi:hypothetical protein